MGSVLFVIDPKPSYVLEKMTSPIYQLGKTTIEVMDIRENPKGFAFCGKAATMSTNSSQHTVACDSFFANKLKLQEKIGLFDDYPSYSDRNADLFAELYARYGLDVLNLTEGSVSYILWDDIENELPNFVNAITNRLCEANSVDARVPFVDDKLIQFVVRLPDHYKIRIFKEKWILRQAMKDLLPMDIIKRKKFGQRFQYDKMLTETLELLGNRFLRNGRFRKRGLFNLRSIETSLNRKKGVPYFSKQAHQIWTLIFIEIVARIFIDAKATCCPECLQDLV